MSTQRQERQRRRPVPGKGHQKSRKGCSSCKLRRVKCSEEQPTCRACRRLGLDCHYTQLPTSAPAISPAWTFSNAPSTFTLEDLRFFHYFLTTAHPQIPTGLGNVWQDVAAMSHEHEFLGHALLGLAAQKLTVSTSADYSIQALSHRVQAITALNQHLSTTSVSTVEGDARLAAVIALTFQSTYMDDGMMEFLRMLRGWMIIQTTIIPSMAQSLFRDFTEEAYVDSMRDLVRHDQTEPSSKAPPRQSGLDTVLRDFEASLHLVLPLCQSPGELEYLSSLKRVVHTARTSPLDALLELVPLYAMTNEMETDEFAHFVNDANFTAQVLLAHFWMLGWVLDSHMLGPSRGFALPEHTALRWVESAARRLPEGHRKYVLWPLGTRIHQGSRNT